MVFSISFNILIGALICPGLIALFLSEVMWFCWDQSFRNFMYLILCGLGFENNETNIMFDVHFQLTVLNILTKVMHSLVNEETERSEETI